MSPKQGEGTKSFQNNDSRINLMMQPNMDVPPIKSNAGPVTLASNRSRPNLNTESSSKKAPTWKAIDASRLSQVDEGQRERSLDRGNSKKTLGTNL
jgi:hypothetical protein